MADRNDRDLNRDPISGAPGSHPAGTGIGGLGGAAAGAAVGSLFGPIGTLVGGAVGTIAGAAAGHAVAENLDPTAETEYWRGEAAQRPYFDDRYDYDRDYLPAYRYGTVARSERRDGGWDDAETDLRTRWDEVKGESRLAWENARDAVRDAWDRTDRTYRVYGECDRHFESRFNQADYYKPDYSFDDYRPAYRLGTYARSQAPSREWDDDIESELSRNWNSARGTSRLSWDEARPAIHEGYEQATWIKPGDTDYRQH